MALCVRKGVLAGVGTVWSYVDLSAVAFFNCISSEVEKKFADGFRSCCGFGPVWYRPYGVLVCDGRWGIPHMERLLFGLISIFLHGRTLARGLGVRSRGIWPRLCLCGARVLLWIALLQGRGKSACRPRPNHECCVESWGTERALKKYDWIQV